MPQELAEGESDEVEVAGIAVLECPDLVQTAMATHFVEAALLTKRLQRPWQVDS